MEVCSRGSSLAERPGVLDTTRSYWQDRPMNDRFVISTEWLAEHLHDTDVRVLDVSGFLDGDRANQAHGDYVFEHLPGAVWFDVASADGELSDPDSTLSWTWPPLSQIEAAMGNVGVGNSTTVVLVARTFDRPLGLGTMWCTRAWWTLHHSGVTCAILEGGHERWLAERRPTESGPVSATTTTFRGEDRRSEAIADRHDVEAALGDGASCVIDALPEASFNGERVNYARPGHITGAQNVPFQHFIAEPTAAFVPVDRARTIFDRAGVLDRERVVLY